ncbi:MAG TPA: NYN domain-containing protein [Candidatus Dormibacteraeota bacterium]|nr:NYN domain-containing protein [Candidatus Dormibacteraeota bacterium]
MKVYIDGENLRHRLVSVLLDQKLIDSPEASFSFDLRLLLRYILGQEPEQVVYYTTRIKQPTFKIPLTLSKRITNIQETSRRWIAALTNQGLDLVKAGQLKVRESSVCIHCGKKTLILQEKGVDVRLATDIVMAAVQDKVQEIAILSSDADMIPALEVVRRSGTRVSYLCFAEELNRAIAAVTDQTITYTRKQIIDVYLTSKSKHPKA